MYIPNLYNKFKLEFQAEIFTPEDMNPCFFTSNTLKLTVRTSFSLDIFQIALTGLILDFRAAHSLS